MEDPRLGHQLRTLRTAAGRTVASVAQDAGLSVPYIANLENGRGNPTITALDRLASALGVRLAVLLVPAGDGAPSTSDAAPQLPASLVRVRRTVAFRHATELMAGALGLDEQAFSVRLTSAMAMLAAAMDTEPSEADWWRLLDAMMLMAAHPQADRDRQKKP
ncbi:MAG TPA: helix-turn-helix domain-containing protein [Streptosporangiaceae bacterium]|nr:helix-turn-helix domain-containing protein [Streptosporangiaceae bacterium]